MGAGAVAGNGPIAAALRIEQSGRYCNLFFKQEIDAQKVDAAESPVLRMKLVEESATSRPGQVAVRLAGRDGELIFTGKSGADQWRLSAVGLGAR